MRHAVVQHTFGGPEVLQVEALPDLEPHAGAARVDVEAAGVHLVDTRIRAGIAGGPFPLPDLPMTPGREVAGTVDRVGDGVDVAWVGRRVAAHLGASSGGYASQAIAPVEALIELPEQVDVRSAVSLLGTGRTAVAILEEATITASDVVLITAAAGGLGTLLVQAAVETGAVVVAAAGGDAKVEFARALGAHLGADYRRPEWPDTARRSLLDREGVTVALDGVGGSIGRAAFDLMSPGGRLIVYGSTAGEPIQFTSDDLIGRSATVSAAIGPRLAGRPDLMRQLAIDAIARAAAGRWRAIVNPPFALSEAPDAHRAIVDRRTIGKVVLVP